MYWLTMSNKFITVILSSSSNSLNNMERHLTFDFNKVLVNVEINFNQDS